jgi:hypothetical protein
MTSTSLTHVKMHVSNRLTRVQCRTRVKMHVAICSDFCSGIKVNIPAEHINMLVGTLEFISDKVKDNHVKFGPT